MADVVPVIGADEPVPYKANSHSRFGNEARKVFAFEVDAGQHRGDGRNDDDEHHRHDVRLRFFVAFSRTTAIINKMDEKKGPRAVTGHK